MRVLTCCIFVLVLSGCGQSTAESLQQVSPVDQQMDLAGKLLRGESPRERAGGE